MSAVIKNNLFLDKVSAPLDIDGAFGFNVHGSLPLDQADFDVEPNFRHFDFYNSNAQPPDADLASRLYKFDEPDIMKASNYSFFQVRSCPTVVSALPLAIVSSYAYASLMGSSFSVLRLNFFSFYTTYFVLQNLQCWWAREQGFKKDFIRNQLYVNDEVRYQRDKQRVREALYEKNFVKNPVAEYRIKSWQIADRFA